MALGGKSLARGTRAVHPPSAERAFGPAWRALLFCRGSAPGGWSGFNITPPKKRRVRPYHLTKWPRGVTRCQHLVKPDKTQFATLPNQSPAGSLEQHNRCCPQVWKNVHCRTFFLRAWSTIVPVRLACSSSSDRHGRTSCQYRRGSLMQARKTATGSRSRSRHVVTASVFHGHRQHRSRESHARSMLRQAGNDQRRRSNLKTTRTTGQTEGSDVPRFGARSLSLGLTEDKGQAPCQNAI
jgi:hypothetical protein